MAKIVSYWADNDDEMYSEGPYVLCAGPMGQGYRVEKKGERCPILVGTSIFALRKARGIPLGWQPFEVLAPFVDDLNCMHKGDSRMLKVTVLKGDGSEELFYAKDMEAQGSVVTFYQSFEDNWRGGGYRSFDMKEEQHIKVERVD